DKMGLSDSAVGSNVDPILAAISCRYLKQLKYPDTVHVGARISSFGRRSSMTMQHRIISEKLRLIVAEGDSTLVAFDYAAQRSVSVPDAVRARVEEIEGKKIPAST